MFVNQAYYTTRRHGFLITSAKVFLDPGLIILMHSETKLHWESGKEFSFFLNFKKIPVALGSFCHKTILIHGTRRLL